MDIYSISTSLALIKISEGGMLILRKINVYNL